MLSSKFESITRSMAGTRTRRGLLTAFAGGIAATLFGATAKPSAANDYIRRCDAQLRFCFRDCAGGRDVWLKECEAPCYEQHRKCLASMPKH